MSVPYSGTSCVAERSGSATQVMLSMPFRDTVAHPPIDSTALHRTSGQPSVMASVRCPPGPAHWPDPPGPPASAVPKGRAPYAGFAALWGAACRGWGIAGWHGWPPGPLLARRGSPPVQPREGATSSRRKLTAGGAWGHRRRTRPGVGWRGLPRHLRTWHVGACRRARAHAGGAVRPAGSHGHGTWHTDPAEGEQGVLPAERHQALRQPARPTSPCERCHRLRRHRL